MNYELPDSEWIERFNDVSTESYYGRYIDTFKPLSAISSISSIVLPSDRHEIEIGLNVLSKDDKNKIKSIDKFNEQVLALIAIIEEMIRHRYKIMKQQCLEKALKYFNEFEDDDSDFSEFEGHDSDYNNITVQLAKFLQESDRYDFPEEKMIQIIKKNQPKHYVDFGNRLLGSLVPLLAEYREYEEFNTDIKNIVEELLKQDIDMMIMDVATEIQRIG